MKYKIKNKKLKNLIEKKAKEKTVSVDYLITCYIQRGLLNDSISDEVFWRLDSPEYLKEINDALNVD